MKYNILKENSGSPLKNANAIFLFHAPQNKHASWHLAGPKNQLSSKPFQGRIMNLGMWLEHITQKYMIRMPPLAVVQIQDVCYGKDFSIKNFNNLWVLLWTIFFLWTN